MDCSDIRDWLCAYLDKELEPETEELVRRHLLSCPVCMKELEVYRASKILVQKKLSRVNVPDCLKKRVLSELERADDYRESGIQVLDLVRWGTHMAQLCNNMDELIEVSVPYLTKGLEQDELCLWITSDVSEDEARDAFRKELPNVGEYLGKGQLDILSYKDWYLEGGRFDSRLVLDKAYKKYNYAISSGYSGLRVVGSIFWLDQSNWDSFMEYENLLNSVISDFKSLVICAYEECKCPKGRIADVVNTHRYVIRKVDNFWRLRRA